MGFYIRRRRKVGEKGHVNVSKSGVSYTHRFGPITVNSRGRINVRLGKGLGFRLGR